LFSRHDRRGKNNSPRTPGRNHHHNDHHNHNHHNHREARFSSTSHNPSPVSSLHDFFNPTDDHVQLRSMLRDFVANEVEPQAREHDRNESLNLPLLRQLGDLGLLGLTVAEDYGGSGLDAAAVALVHEELSYSDPGLCLSYLAHSLLLVNNIHANGSPEQKERFLPRAVRGEHLGGMGMSEASAGTDVLGMATRATEDESTGLWHLTGQKMWITNGTLDDGKSPGDLFLVYGRTGPNRTDITSFVVEKGTPGFSVGQKITDKLGMRASVSWFRPSPGLVASFATTNDVCSFVRSLRVSLSLSLAVQCTTHAPVSVESRPRNSSSTMFPSRPKTFSER